MVATRTGREQERRTARRYNVSLPIFLCSIPPKFPEVWYGRTHDISAYGIYFTSDQEFILSSELDFTMTILAELMFGTEVLIRARGKVVRVEKKKERRLACGRGCRH